VEEVYRKNTADVLEYELDGVNRLEHMEALKVFADTDALDTELQALLKNDPLFSGWEISPRKAIPMDAWAESWKQHWKPTRIHEHLTICPSWLDYTPENPDERVISLDPGAAFGTGTHETTSLMLQQMYTLSKQVDFSKISVLDVGTGSGILAIYAAMLGCKSIIGVDNDPNSVPAAIENAELNSMNAACTFSATPLEDLCHTKHELVLANIIAPVILALMDGMKTRLADNGHLLLSGLIEKNLPDIETSLKEHHLTIEKRQQQGDWFSVLAKP
jgi:ribosomal protein L11 methyltransferase